MNSSAILGWTAALIDVVASYIYFLHTRSGAVRPNPATWMIWTALCIIGSFSFLETSHDLFSTLQFFVSAGGCVAIFVYAVATGRSAPLRTLDWVFAGTGLCALAGWWLLGSPAFANTLVNIVLFVSFFPIWQDLWTDTTRESPLVWWLWTLAFGITLLNVILHRDGNDITLVAPGLEFVGHAATALLAQRRLFARPVASAAAS